MLACPIDRFKGWAIGCLAASALGACEPAEQFQLRAGENVFLANANICGDGSEYNPSLPNSNASAEMVCTFGKASFAVVEGRLTCRDVAFCRSAFSSIESNTACAMMACKPGLVCSLIDGVAQCVDRPCGGTTCPYTDRCVETTTGPRCLPRCLEDSSTCPAVCFDLPQDGVDEGYCASLCDESAACNGGTCAGVEGLSVSICLP